MHLPWRQPLGGALQLNSDFDLALSRQVFAPRGGSASAFLLSLTSEQASLGARAVRTSLPSPEVFQVKAGYQALFYDEYTIEGELILDGDLVVL